MIRFVVFDLGQVLASPPDIYHAPAELLGVDPDAYRELYWSHRRAYDTGGSRVEYWQPILDRLGVQPSGELISSLATLDADLWTELRPTAAELLQVVQGWNVQTALLSNAPMVLGKALRRTAWAAAFDWIFISAEPGEIAFIDDRGPNVDAAAAAGWNAHLWVDDEDSLTWLKQVTGH